MKTTRLVRSILSTGLVLLITGGFLYAGPPVIKDFSSTGGNPENKTGPKDTMYLVRPGDKITFSVKTEGAEKYEWQVNKEVDKEASGETFAWTVPNEKAVWEIHLTVTGGGGESHQEWVVSTLSKSEAPDFFEYFTDCKSFGRTEKDPWGRPLPEWSGGEKEAPHVGNGFVDSKEGVTWSKTSSSVAYGTWRFRYRFPDAMKKRTATDFQFHYIIDGDGKYTFSQCSDSHHHCTIQHKEAWFSIDYDCGVFLRDNWHQVTIIRTRDGWLYMFRNNRLEFLTHDEAVSRSETMFLDVRGPDKTARYFDGLEVYADKYLFPKRAVAYGEYISNYSCKTRSYPIKKKGIVLSGQDFTLPEIAKNLNDPALFSYDESTKTAVCSTNLVVDEGAELLLKNETLKFRCTADGELEFAPKYGSRVHVEDSTLTSTGEHYWVWNCAGSTTHYGYEVGMEGGDTTDYYELFTTLAFSYHGRLTLKNSLVDNVAHIFFDSPYELDLSNTRFTNLREADIGNYTFEGSYEDAVKQMRLFAKGDKGFWIYTDDLNLDGFNLRGLKFTGHRSPLNLTFLINAHRDKLNLYDMDAPGENVVIKESLAQTSRQSHTSYSAGPPYVWKSYLDSGLGLVNCRFKDLRLAPGLPVDRDGNPVRKFAAVKYYLDVKVVDAAGRPVPNAKVTVTNEVDDANYPAENLQTIKPYTGNPDVVDGGEYVSYYHHRRVVQGLPTPSTLTGPDGHIPLPSDPARSMVLTDYVKKIEDAPDGMRIRWVSHWSDVRYINFDLYDDVHGNILHQVKYAPLKDGDKQHVKVTYDPKDATVRLIITDPNGQAVWDTGSLKIAAQMEPYVIDQLEFETRKAHATNRIAWDNGHILMDTQAYRGQIIARLDNMNITTPQGVVERNDYSKDPGLVATAGLSQPPEKTLTGRQSAVGREHYDLAQSTGGQPFVWEFDVSLDRFKTDGPWIAVWLKKAGQAGASQQDAERIINYKYTITVEKDGKKKIITGVNPGPDWYRPEPNKPTYTITAVLDGQTVTETELKKTGLVGQPRLGK